jgi:hypothetical protein
VIPEDHRDLFTRDEHVTMLTLERYQLGELRDDEATALHDHAQSCDSCSAALTSVMDVISLPVARLRRKSTWRVAAAAAVLVAAAAVAALYIVTDRSDRDRVATIQGDKPDDGIRVKGPAFSMQVHVHDGNASRRAGIGEIVHPGDRLGFVAQGREAGHLLIVGTDDRGNTYPCHPQNGVSERVVGDDSSWRYTTRSAVRVDDTLGHEHILGVLCAAPITSAQLQPALDQIARGKRVTTIPSGCTYRVTVLSKEGPAR